MPARRTKAVSALELETPSIAVAYPRLLMQVVHERGCDASELLRAARLKPAVLEVPDGLISASAYALMITRAMRLTGDPCIGCEMGLRMPPTMHGHLGYAAVSSANLNEALQLFARYFRLASPFVQAQLDSADGRMLFTLKEISPLGAVRQFVMESALIGVYRGATLLAGAPAQASDLSLCFSWSRPEAFARYAGRLPPTVFDAQSDQIDCAFDHLQRPLMLADPLAARRAAAQCEEDFARLGQSGASFSVRVSACLKLSPNGGYPSIDDVAARFQMSTRTLARRLSAQGAGFAPLLDERRCLDAKLMLSQSDTPIEAIAVRLGYAEPANFTRAFRRWTGDTPSGFRRLNRQQP